MSGFESTEKTPEQLAEEQRISGQEARLAEEQRLADARLKEELAMGIATPTTQHQARPVVPATSPPAATVPAQPDPNALPSNVAQLQEVHQREMEEMARTPAFRGAFPVAEGDAVYPPRDLHMQQPGAPAQQFEYVNPTSQPVISEKTRAEMEAGKKQVEVTKSAQEAREELVAQAKLEEEQRLAAMELGEGGEQGEAKAKEAFRREQVWGGGKVERTTGAPEGAIQTSPYQQRQSA